MNLLTIFSFIARLIWSCGIWCLVYLEFIGLCLCLSMGYLVASKVDLVTIVMEIYGWLFLIVCCGASGRREIVGALKTSSAPCLTSSSYFSKLYWSGSLCGGTIFFLLFWIYLIFVMFAIDLFPLYTPVYLGVSLFFINEILLLIKKKRYRIRFSNNKTQKTYHIVFLFHFFVLMKGHSDEIFKSSKNSLWRTIRNSRNLKCHFDAPLRLGPHLMIVIH